MLYHNILDISDPETDNETLRPIYKISGFIPKLKKWGAFYKTCENCRENQNIYRFKNRI